MTRATGYGPDHTFFLDDGKTAWWVARDPYDKDKVCEQGHFVPSANPRGWVRDFSAKATKASHGHSRRFYCENCMMALGSPEVPRW